MLSVIFANSAFGMCVLLMYDCHVILMPSLTSLIVRDAMYIRNGSPSAAAYVNPNFGFHDVMCSSIDLPSANLTCLIAPMPFLRGVVICTSLTPGAHAGIDAISPSIFHAFCRVDLIFGDVRLSVALLLW